MVETKHCFKCGYQWEARIPNPKACPACNSRHWHNKEKYRIASIEPASVIEGKAG